MKRVVLISLALAALAGACTRGGETTPATPADCLVTASARSGEVIPGEFIVTFRETEELPGGTLARRTDPVSTVLTEYAVSDSAVEARFEGGAPGLVAHLSDAQAAELGRDSRVLAVEPDRILSLCSCLDVEEPRSLTWDVRKTGYGNGLNFKDKTAWIIDTGIDFTHPDLAVDQTRSRSFVSGQTSANDQNGHGTHVAGVIGALNNRLGILGIASGATLVALKVLNQEGEGKLSATIQAVAYVVQNGKAGDVVNLSLGGDGVSPTLESYVKAAADKGILFAIAAGNEGKPAREFSPARFNHPNVFTVTAVDSTDTFASFSNYGNDVVDVAAYGVRIPSTYLGGRYAILSGTSMAAPHVAGLLLIRGKSIPTRGTARNDPDGVPDPIARE
jgi:subtilisin family serine protease